jgi:hypothetical protein
MRLYRSLDAEVKARLKQWPQRPPGLQPDPLGRDAWLRGRPSDELGTCQPFLKCPGSARLRTLPDGLWLNFCGTPVEPFVDIFAIEACATLPNLHDKRFRFAPSTHSLLAVCPIPWLLAPVLADDPTPRWMATGVLPHEPPLPFVVTVRDVRVLYVLQWHDYVSFVRHQIPHPHEYFAPMETLIAKDSDKNPDLRALLWHASAGANFLNPTP